KLKNVLNIGATSFSSNWLLETINSASQLRDMHPYERGMAGLWRPKSSHVYNSGKVERTSTESTDLSMDGTHDAIAYLWKSPIADQLPSWLTASTMTKYNSESQEVENKDVLGIYTSSIYGFGGNLPVAAGSNMSNQEMGFTSFEDLSSGSQPISGNFVFGTEAINIPISAPIESGRSNVLVIDLPLAELNAAFDWNDKVYILTDGHVVQATILCTGEDIVNGENPYPGKSFVVLDERVIESDEVFYGGTMMKENEHSGSAYTLYSGWAHSGQKSLLIEGAPNPVQSRSFKQPIFDLNIGETYSFYCWASTKADDVYYEEANIAHNVEVLVQMDGITVGTIELYGRVIEGWQQLRGTFTVPEEGYDELQITFRKPSATPLYIDDIRIFPLDGNMQGFVYDDQLRLQATLDENNYATFYDYDGENTLFLVRKETERGIKTIQQTISNQKGPASN
ncbi:MAG: hypothetical protein AAFO69_01670, partial [Bacteroidota bacterium]